MRRFLCISALAFSILPFAAAQAQSYPDHPIRFIAPTTPGVMADTLARALALAMSKALHQSIYVENKPGADQQIGLDYIARGAPADGYAVGVIGLDGQSLMTLTKRDLRFNPLKDLTLVAGLGEVRYVLAGPNKAPYKNFAELVAGAKANAGKFNYGSSTPQVHLYSAELARALGLEMTHVPYPSGAPFLMALVAGDLDWGLLAEGTSTSQKSRLRLYAVTGTSRSANNPDVPTFAELGFPRIKGPAYAVVVRTGTPQAIISKLSAATAEALASPEMKASAKTFQFEIDYQNADAVARVSEERFKFYQDLIKSTGLKPE